MPLLRNLKHRLKRLVNPPGWHNLRNLEPVSEIFGLDRGTPVDRYYIDKFISSNSGYVKGHVLEISESIYSKQFGKDVTSFEVLHYTNDNPNATIIGDLTDASTLPENKIDCFICTQTLQFIYNFKDAIRGTYHLLKPGGTALVTVAGISQISAYDMQRWGDFWRFTTKSARLAFEEVFGEGQVTADSFGNVLTSTAFLQGISVEELTQQELDHKDENYQLLITVVARKPM
jgi:hypothetical protein